MTRSAPSPTDPGPGPGATAFSHDGAASPNGHEAELERLLATVDARFPGAGSEVVRRAFARAEAAHHGQSRASGEPYITHPLAVAQILAHLGLDPEAIAAAILHDVVEDTTLDKAAIADEFGDEVAQLVDGVTKISAIEAREKAAAEAESLRRMLLAAVEDLRVILIKLADRLHNMQTLGPLSDERRERMARETLEIYAPLANRLGIRQFKSQFEDLALRELDPRTYESIRARLHNRRQEREAYLEDVIDRIDAKLRENGIEAEIQGRAKNIYSIWRKMQRKEVGAEQVYDVLAIRILVEDMPQCYLALGLIHSMWQPITGQFDDYIAKQKNNLYRSLHTTVFGPGNRPLEVQIRTREMHEDAEFGVAAHWMYKENSRRARELEGKIAALRRLLERTNEDAVDAQAFVEGLKTDVFQDQVYVFTPAGDVVELPAGSTPVDFAYYIHSEVGHRCRGAEIDGKMASLDTELETGQTVKVNTATGEVGPSRDWLNPSLGYVHSSRAKSTIKQWFRRQARHDAIGAGRDVLERRLRKLGLTRIKHETVAHLFDFDRLEDFLAAVGRHDIPSEAIAARLLKAESRREAPPAIPSRQPQPTGTAPRAKPEPARGVTMRGADGVFTRVGRCCRPVPGDEVVGYITRGRGVTLHHSGCMNIARQRTREPDRFIHVNWQRSGSQSYPVELRIRALDRAGLVRDITDLIAKREITMTTVSATTDPRDGLAIVTAMVAIGSAEELTTLIDKLDAIDNVLEVVRPTS